MPDHIPDQVTPNKVTHTSGGESTQAVQYVPKTPAAIQAASDAKLNEIKTWFTGICAILLIVMVGLCMFNKVECKDLIIVLGVVVGFLGGSNTGKSSK